METPAVPDYFSKYETLAFERSDDGVLVLSLHSDGGPVDYCHVHHREWPRALTDVAGDRDNRVVVITGTGESFIDKHGAWGKPHRAPVDLDRSSWNERTFLGRLLDIEAPIIGAVNGPARIHAELAVLSNITLASTTAEFADDGHFPKGEVPGDGVAVVWEELLGMNRGQYFLLTGQTLTADRALELGVVNEVLPPEELLPRALELAHQMATYSDLVLRYTRRVLVDRWRRLFFEQAGIGYGMALQHLSLYDRGWLMWDGTHEDHPGYAALRPPEAR